MSSEKQSAPIQKESWEDEKPHHFFWRYVVSPPVRWLLMYFLIQSPPGFVFVNLVYSFKAHYEFSRIHTKILQLVVYKDEKVMKAEDC